MGRFDIPHQWRQHALDAIPDEDGVLGGRRPVEAVDVAAAGGIDDLRRAALGAGRRGVEVEEEGAGLQARRRGLRDREPETLEMLAALAILSRDSRWEVRRSVAELLAETIRRIAMGESVSTLYVD